MQQFINDKWTSNIKAVYDQNFDQIVYTMLDEILEATRINPLNWSSSLPKAPDQLDESYVEQCASLEIGVKN